MSSLARTAIINSFTELINQRSLDKITIKDITDRCGLTRNTFYYHFQDIFDVIDSVFKAEAGKVLESGDMETIEENFKDALKFVSENHKGILHIYSSVDRVRLENYLSEVIGIAVKKQIEMETKDLVVDELDRHIFTIFFEQGVVGMILEWIDSGMKEEPSVAIGRIVTMFDGLIRKAFENCQKK